MLTQTDSLIEHGNASKSENANDIEMTNLWKLNT